MRLIPFPPWLAPLPASSLHTTLSMALLAVRLRRADGKRRSPSCCPALCLIQRHFRAPFVCAACGCLYRADERVAGMVPAAYHPYNTNEQ